MPEARVEVIVLHKKYVVLLTLVGMCTSPSRAMLHQNQSTYTKQVFLTPICFPALSQMSLNELRILNIQITSILESESLRVAQEREKVRQEKLLKKRLMDAFDKLCDRLAEVEHETKEVTEILAKKLRENEGLKQLLFKSTFLPWRFRQKRTPDQNPLYKIKPQTANKHIEAIDKSTLTIDPNELPLLIATIRRMIKEKRETLMVIHTLIAEQNKETEMLKTCLSHAFQPKWPIFMAATEPITMIPILDSYFPRPKLNGAIPCHQTKFLLF